MSNPVSITDLLTAIGSDNIKFQYLATCMEGIKGAKGRNLITFGTDALTPSDVVLNTGPSGLIIWVDGDLIRQSLSDIKSGNGLAFSKVVEQRDGLLAALEGYMGAVARMNQAMQDGFNVQGALSELLGYEHLAQAAIAKAKGGAA